MTSSSLLILWETDLLFAVGGAVGVALVLSLLAELLDEWVWPRSRLRL